MVFTSIGSIHILNKKLQKSKYIIYNLLAILFSDFCPCGLGLAQTTFNECPFKFNPTSATFSAANSAEVLVVKLINAQRVLCATITDLISPNT